MDRVLVNRATVVVLEVVLNCTHEPAGGRLCSVGPLLLGRAGGGSQRPEAHG